jgi:hypothetical protein
MGYNNNQYLPAGKNQTKHHLPSSSSLKHQYPNEKNKTQTSEQLQTQNHKPAQLIMHKKE